MHQAQSQPSAQSRSQTLTLAFRVQRPGVPSADPERCGNSPEVTQQPVQLGANRCLMNMTFSLMGRCCFVALDKPVGPELMQQILQPNQLEDVTLAQEKKASCSFFLSLCLCERLSASLSLSLFHSRSLSGSAGKGVGVGSIQLAHPGSHGTLSNGRNPPGLVTQCDPSMLLPE